LVFLIVSELLRFPSLAVDGNSWIGAGLKEEMGGPM